MNAPQQTADWLKARAGHATASRFKDVLAKIKTGEAATRAKYRIQLVTERLTGLPVEGFKNNAMAWGTEREPEARMAYEVETGQIVQEFGFILHPDVQWVGASPDGFVGADGMVEIKCPYESTVHVMTLTDGMPTEHTAQIQGNLWVNGRKWCDFVSYDPRMPEGLQVYRQRIERDDKYIAKLAEEIQDFLLGVSKVHQQLMEKADGIRATRQ